MLPVSLYAAFVYGVLYAKLGDFAITFEEKRGREPMKGNLPFMPLRVGILAAAVLNVYNNKYHFKRFVENGNRAVSYTTPVLNAARQSEKRSLRLKFYSVGDEV